MTRFKLRRNFLFPLVAIAILLGISVPPTSAARRAVRHQARVTRGSPTAFTTVYSDAAGGKKMLQIEGRRRPDAKSPQFPLSVAPSEVEWAGIIPRSLARAYTRYNQSVEPEPRLAGLQYDIELYLLPGYTVGPEAWAKAYLMARREEQFGAWSSFAGWALHGMDSGT